MDASVFHYRDSTDLEVDASVERRDGAWAAFEVKLGQDPEKHGKPAALAVITGWGDGYRCPDGVAVIPIGALAP